MSPYPNFLAPRTSLSGRIQIGHKSGFIIFIIIIIMSSVNIKPTRHRFGFSLAWDWQYTLRNKTLTDTQTKYGWLCLDTLYDRELNLKVWEMINFFCQVRFSEIDKEGNVH